MQFEIQRTLANDSESSLLSLKPFCVPLVHVLWTSWFSIVEPMEVSTRCKFCSSDCNVHCKQFGPNPLKLFGKFQWKQFLVRLGSLYNIMLFQVMLGDLMNCHANNSWLGQLVYCNWASYQVDLDDLLMPLVPNNSLHGWMAHGSWCSNTMQLNDLMMPLAANKSLHGQANHRYSCLCQVQLKTCW